MIGRRFRRAMENLDNRKDSKSPRIRRAAATCVEALEKRTLLTAVFDPTFGVETQKQGNGDVMRKPAINIIFWGPYWQGGNGDVESQWNSNLSIDAQNLLAATETLVSSTYFNVTTQYGSDPSNMFVNDTAWDSSSPPAKFDNGQLDDVVQNKIENGPFPEPDNQKGLNGEHELPIEVVVTQPGVTSTDPNAAAFNTVPLDFYFPDFERTPEIWVGTHIDTSTPNNHVNVDTYTKFLGHEIAEIMTDYNGNGYQVNTPSLWTGGGDDQIGDKEGNVYSYRMPDGINVQPLWSAQDFAWVVTDGASQIFNLHPNWTNDSFDGNYALTINGDQNFANFNDNVILGTGANGGVQVTLNGETLNFDPKYISHVTVDTGLGSNTLTDNGLPLGITANTFSTLGTVSLTVPGPNTFWEIHSQNSVEVNQSFFSDVSNLTGGSGPDDFELLPGGSISGNIDGGPGGNNFILYSTNYSDPVTTNAINSTTTGVGGTLVDVHNFDNEDSNGGTFIGPSGNWSIDGADVGSIPGQIGFLGYSDLSTGDQDDTFAFTQTGALDSINAGLGTNTLDVSGLAHQVLANLQTQSATGAVKSFSGIQRFIGKLGDSDSLVGPDVSSVWTLTGADSGTVGTVSFAGFEFIAGGIADDQFEFKPGGSISGIQGQAGANTLDYSALPGPITVNFQNSSATGIFFNFNGITNIIGSQSGADTIVGPDASWLINGANSGSVNGITFSSIENLFGSPQTDTFTFLPGGNVAGNVDGGGGTDTLDYSNLTTPVTLNFSTQSATGIGGTFSNISGFVGGQGSNNIVGPDTATTWTVTGVNTVNALGTTFNNFPNITGGPANDTFAVLSAGRLDGKIDGGGGIDTLTYAQFAGNVIVDLTLHSATRIAQGVVNIENVSGGIGDSLLVGDTGNNSLVGGTGRNLLIGESGADSLIGGGGDNILIGDSSIWDSNMTALSAIFAEWTRTDLSFEKRVSDLLSSSPNGLNGSYSLDKKAIVADSSDDSLVGSTGLDWFFETKKLDSILGGDTAGDHVTEV